MKTPKLLKGIAKKFKNRKGSKETEIQEPSISSSTTGEEGKKLSEEVLNKEVTIKQQVVTGKSVPAEEEVHEVCDVEHKSVIDTDIKLYNINSEDLQPISESSEEAQIETTVEPTFVDRETNEQEPNPAEIELCFTIDEKDKPPTKTTQQRQAILAIGLALYNITNPNTKLEKVKSVEQPVIQFPLNPT